MNEILTVRDFGPIKDATVEFKRVTVFIGPTGGGKSTLAKLAAIWKAERTLSEIKEKGGRVNEFEEFNLGGYYNDNSAIECSDTAKGIKIGWSRTAELELQDPAKRDAVMANNKAFLKTIAKNVASELRKAGHDSVSKNILAKLDESAIAEFFIQQTQKQLFPAAPVYVPSERIFYSAISFSLAGLMRDDIGLPKSLLDFINSFSQAKREVTDLDLPLFSAKYEQRDGDDYIRLVDREKPLRLSETASGIQSVAPMLVLLEHLSRQIDRPQSFIIEEPELNLYPEAQQALLNVLVAKCAKTNSKNELIITTHSPYLLSHLNLLLYAPQVAKNHRERADEIKALVPEESWIQPGDLAVYYVNGPEGATGVRSLLDPETSLIAQNALDTTAGQQADAFDRLLDINSGF